ncbi:CopG family transcriptional regulator, partial [Salmonella enterica]|nr:CopG family transcriptional regulator [Salmonella enterica]
MAQRERIIGSRSEQTGRRKTTVLKAALAMYN